MSGRTDERPPTTSLGDDATTLFLENVTDYAIFMLDVNGNVATWNAGAQRIKGYTKDEIVGKHFSAFYTDEDRASDLPARELALAQKVGRVEDEGIRLRKGGERFSANVVITAVYDAAGTLRGFGKITRDLSQRRGLEFALRSAEDRFAHLIDAVTDYAIYMLDPTGRVATWNAGAERTKGYLAHEIVGQSFALFYTEDDRAAGKPAAVLETVRREGRFEEESFRLRKDGTRFWANVVITALRNTRGEIEGFVKVTRDLTEKRDAEDVARELLRAQAAREAAEASERTIRESEQRARDAADEAERWATRAEEASRLKDEFLATVSHELRTPLNAILGWSFLLKEKNKDPDCEKAVDAIYRNAQTQAHTIDDILDVSRIITGTLKLETVPVDLALTVSEALAVVRPSATAKEVELRFDAFDGAATINGDVARLRQVVWNLLSNAVKFTDRGGEVVVSIARAPSAITLTVRDTGRGIDPAVLPHVFERFTQADSSSTRRFGGLGLGLAIVRHVVELHGGRVRAESGGLGSGATFRVTLPTGVVGR